MGDSVNETGDETKKSFSGKRGGAWQPLWLLGDSGFCSAFRCAAARPAPSDPPSKRAGFFDA